QEQLTGGALVLGQNLSDHGVGLGQRVGTAQDLVDDLRPQQLGVHVFVLGLHQGVQGRERGGCAAQVEVEAGQFLEGGDVGGVVFQSAVQQCPRLTELAEPTTRSTLHHDGGGVIGLLGAHLL